MENNKQEERFGTFTDKRDGKTYKTVKMPDGKIWMAENLNYETESGSWCYDNDPSNAVKYGRLYDWNTAKTVCPRGWRLPSRSDWHRLCCAVNDDMWMEKDGMIWLDRA